MQIIEKSINEITPYENNPRKNDEAVELVKNSIKEFGFKVPIVIDKDGVIVAGHTRLKAAKKLGLKSVPCIIADDLNDDQIKAFRLADNKVGEAAEWDYGLLEKELDDIKEFNMADFGFLDDNADDFINDLLNEEFMEHNTDNENFSVSFVFDIKNKLQIDLFIKNNGKEPIVKKILEFTKNA